MSFLDGILGQVAGNADVANLAEKIGLPAGQVEKAIAVLADKHQAPGDTVTEAAAATGIDAGKLSDIVSSIGGEGSLSRFNELIAQDSGIAGTIAGFLDRDGDGSPLNDIADIAKGLFGRK